MELTINDNIVLYSSQDHDRISSYNWYLDSDGYARAKIKGKMVKMHRFILNADKGVPVDHLNGNRLDNRRSNIYLTTPKLNGQNKSKRDGVSSIYHGVSYTKGINKYKSRICINNKTVYIGSFENPIEAAEARDMVIVHDLPKSNYKLNFPENLETYKKTEYNRRYAPILKKNLVDIKDLPVKSFYEDTDDENVVRLLIANKPDVFVLIDRNDYDIVKYYTYHVRKDNYIATNNVSCGHHKIHRFIMGVEDSSIFIDHVDGNKHNNIRRNLRHSNAKLNAQNTRKNVKRTSKYYGVYYIEKRKRWVPNINFNGKQQHLGYFRSEIAAALTRDLFILKNIPNSHYNFNYQIMVNQYKLDHDVPDYEEPPAINYSEIIDDL